MRCTPGAIPPLRARSTRGWRRHVRPLRPPAPSRPKPCTNTVQSTGLLPTRVYRKHRRNDGSGSQYKCSRTSLCLRYAWGDNAISQRITNYHNIIVIQSSSSARRVESSTLYGITVLLGCCTLLVILVKLH